MLKLQKFFDTITDIVGYIAVAAMLLMTLNVFYDVIMRYFFLNVSIAMQELEWHLFSVLILFGISYALKSDQHVRVDLIYDNLSDRKKAMINMIGAVIFILPITLIVGISSIDNAYAAYTSMEKSGDPGGLPYRFIVKGLIPVAFLFLLFSTIGFFLKNLNVYNGLLKFDNNALQNTIKELQDQVQSNHKSELK